MPTNIQLKILSNVVPELYRDPEAENVLEAIPIAPLDRFDFPSILSELSRVGIAVCDGVFSPELCSQVRAEIASLDLQPGRMGLKWQDDSFRGDHMKWLSKAVVEGKPMLSCVLQHMDSWREQINAIANSDLTRINFMAAVYPGNGARYVRHSDVSELAPTRRITAILYLNENWTPACGGALHIDSLQDVRFEVAPHSGRVVFFKSELMHEVRPAFRERAALTGWFYAPNPQEEEMQHQSDR
eukprot:TRINITY_DN2537_c0_g1_i2.p1 TRINITY_DN2537_c0_g1~~TRINITY_DN2537_c0_g1_i2.p1  ORF type:complete len:242 (-),score=45.48 TRINITY_DN2537_c0_g1_i2:56-781(-)